MGIDTLKPLPIKFSNITPTTEMVNPFDSTRATDDDAQIVTAGQVEIRSYTQFTFTTAPPFRFLFAPGSVGIGEKLRFMLGKKGGKLEKSEPAISVQQQGCIEVLVGGNEQGTETWEVQVERV
jgi:hypothetical protein